MRVVRCKQLTAHPTHQHGFGAATRRCPGVPKKAEETDGSGYARGSNSPPPCGNTAPHYPHNGFVTTTDAVWCPGVVDLSQIVVIQRDLNEREYRRL